MLKKLFELFTSADWKRVSSTVLPSYQIRSMQKSINELTAIRDSFPIDEITNFGQIGPAIILPSPNGSVERRRDIVNQMRQHLCDNMFTADMERRIPVFCWPFLDCYKNPTQQKIVSELNKRLSDIYVRSRDVVDVAIQMIVDLDKKGNHEELVGMMRAFCQFRQESLRNNGLMFMFQTAGVEGAAMTMFQIPVAGTPWIRYPIVDGVYSAAPAQLPQSKLLL